MKRNRNDIFKAEWFYPAVDEALNNVCKNTYRREPCYTAALTKELPKILERNQSEISGTKYRFGSCYIHQKPYVRFGPKFDLRCELGDLLVIVKKIINGLPAYNSTLFQLKKTMDEKYSIPKGCAEDKQLTLYTKWGNVKIDLKSELAKSYDITPHAVSQGGFYMFIRQDRKNPKFVISVPDRKMKTMFLPSLGRYLSEMIEWRCGRAIAPKDDMTSDDWSRLIWRVVDLIENAKSSCKGYGNIYRNNGCAELAFLMNHTECESIGESNEVEIEDVKSDSYINDGFGVLYIEELREDNEYERNIH